MDFQSWPRRALSRLAIARVTDSFLAHLILLALAGTLTIAGLLYVERHDDITPGIPTDVR